MTTYACEIDLIQWVAPGGCQMEHCRVPFRDDKSAPELIDERCPELERGARMVDAMITNAMLPEIGQEFLSRLAAGSEIKRVHVATKHGNFSFGFD